MIRETKVKSRQVKIAALFQMALLGIFLSAALIGCALGKIKVIDPNTQVERMPKGTNYVAPTDGYFVPDATMLRILDRLSEKDVWSTNSTR